MHSYLVPYEIPMIIVFCVGYILITLEHITKINKATIALLIAVICWGFEFANKNFTGAEHTTFLTHHLADISQVVFFLIGALTIVEIINVHQGFKILSDAIAVNSKKKLFWIVGGFAFFLSAVLDNLTTTIVMISLISKLVSNREDRLLIGAGVVIAANAGGAWTPIGDVTTTMLWIGGQISPLLTMRDLFLPSLACGIASLLVLSRQLKGDFPIKVIVHEPPKSEPYGSLIFFLGISLLIFVPIFKLLTGMPPFMGVLFGVSILWITTDLLHSKYDEREHLRVPGVLTRLDLSGVLFFLGILLCVDALESAKILEQLAIYFDRTIGNSAIIATLIGLASAIIDNVPLVAATMGMYDFAHYPPDDRLWQMIAYCAGTGGSILIIGSAAGVVFMAMEKVDFFWYFKRISLAAAVGYFVGFGIYLLL